MIAKKKSVTNTPVDVIIFAESGFEMKAMKVAQDMRKQGLNVENSFIDDLESVREYACEKKIANAMDVITYVDRGVCDLGVVGKDTIMESNGRFYELVDLGFGRCKFALAGKKGVDFYEGFGVKTVATKYPNVTRNFFEGKGMDIDIVKIEGSVELAPLLDLANGIVDIVETGTTLKENGLEVYEDVAPISARLIANTVSLKLRQNEIESLIDLIESKL